MMQQWHACNAKEEQAMQVTIFFALDPSPNIHGCQVPRLFFPFDNISYLAVSVEYVGISSPSLGPDI